MKTDDATIEDKVGIMTTPSFQIPMLVRRPVNKNFNLDPIVNYYHLGFSQWKKALFL